MNGQDEIGSDQTQIIKGKRTKRQRSSSTFMVATTNTITSTSSSADEYNSAVTSTDCTEEEEDMAICLIMLARGVVPSPDLKNSTKLQSDHNSNFYVYECKTCNRTFSSFQALGGHRASHKKPKSPLVQPKSSGVEEGQNGNTKVSASGSGSGSALASQTSNISKGNKVHECSICGSEFSSGQALGGHMRRHRTATTVSPVTTSEVEKLQRKYLPLDLNLPAPEDDLRDQTSKFEGIVFSATPALVDCHY